MASPLLTQCSIIFCFGTFADKNTGIIYNDCRGEFPYVSLDVNVCFIVMYHYETNTVFAAPIPVLDSKSILAVYVTNFEYLVSTGYTLKINFIYNTSSLKM
jgi:hypothetical protein